MTQAFLDTTILADATLKDRKTRDQTGAALRQFEVVEFPAYAIKEFKAGPLFHYRYVHNVLVDHRSFTGALGRVMALRKTPMKNKFSTALEAVDRLIRENPWAMSDEQYAEDLRIHLKRIIFDAWDYLLSYADRITFPLECYELSEPRELADGIRIVFDNRGCEGAPCALAARFHGHQHELGLLVTAIRQQPLKRENAKRLGAIARLQELGQLSDSECRDMGDAVFALLAPAGFVILTTNIGDHEPLAAALGKKAGHPRDFAPPASGDSDGY
jgi:hypothetical protein